MGHPLVSGFTKDASFDSASSSNTRTRRSLDRYAWRNAYLSSILVHWSSVTGTIRPGTSRLENGSRRSPVLTARRGWSSTDLRRPHRCETWPHCPAIGSRPCMGTARAGTASALTINLPIGGGFVSGGPTVRRVRQT